MDCDEIRTRLHSYLDGELDSLARQEVERHIERCGDCQRALEQCAQDDAMFTLPGGPSEGLADRVTARLRERRPARWIAVAAAVLLCLGVGAVAVHSLRPIEPDPRTIVRVTTLKGQVEHRRHADREWIAVPESAAIAEGSQLRTGRDSLASVTTGSKEAVLLDSHTEAVFTPGRVRLIRGRLFADVPTDSTEFSVRASHSQVTVEGTKFMVEVDPAGTVALTVAEGVALLSNAGGRARVPAGQRSAAPPGDAPSPPAWVVLAHSLKWTGVDLSGTPEFPAPRLSISALSAARTFVLGKQTPTFLVEIDYAGLRYGPLVLACRASTGQGAPEQGKAVDICGDGFRYKAKEVSLDVTEPGRYLASFGIEGTPESTWSTADFSVRR